MKPFTRFACVLSLGIVMGAAGANALPYLGVNLRLLPWTTNGQTLVSPDRGIHASRVERIFSQFAHQLRPDCSSQEVDQVLKATWLKREMIHGVYVTGGRMPIKDDNAQAYVIVLKSDTDDQTGTIWIGLSGGAGTEEEAFLFLTGKGAKEIKMTEFVLDYPPCLTRFGRSERFTSWGIQVRDEY